MSTEYLNNKLFEQTICKFQKSKRMKTRYELILDDLNCTTERKSLRCSDNQWDKRMICKFTHLFNTTVNDYNTSQSALAAAFYTLSENLVKYARFNLIDPDDAVQEGVMICFEKVDRFDSRKGRAFNYMTTCILNHFRQLYRTARNYNELKKKYHDFLQIQMTKAIIKNGKEISTYKVKDNLIIPF